MSPAENEESVRRGLAVFSKWTPPAGATYHTFVGRLDGGGGFAVVETDNPADLSDTTSKFGFIAEYQIYPVVDIDQAAQSLQQGVDFRESIKLNIADRRHEHASAQKFSQITQRCAWPAAMPSSLHRLDPGGCLASAPIG